MEHVSKYLGWGTEHVFARECADVYLPLSICASKGEHAQCTCAWMKVLSTQFCWCPSSAASALLQPGLTGPVGAGLPGQAVPTLSSLLTFQGYSGSCQQAQPAENFAPCTMVASSPVGAFSQTAHSIYTSPLCLARRRASV